MFEKERRDHTQGVHVGTVAKLAGPRAWVRFHTAGRAPWQYGPCAVPDAITGAHTVTVSGTGDLTVTPVPLNVGAQVAVLISPTGGYILARY